MKKRWFIRSIFIGLLTLCVAAWVGSYWRAFSITCWHTSFEYGWPEGIGQEVVVINRGGFGLGWSDWRCDLAMGFERPYHWRTLGFMGFGLFIREHFIIIPLWLPTLLSALLLYFAWRKTRAEPRGFPVELAAAKTEGGQK